MPSPIPLVPPVTSATLPAIPRSTCRIVNSVASPPRRSCRATSTSAGPPAVPRPSATVLLLRGRRPWELLLVHRPGGADFAPGAYVFPGGTVHDGDRTWADDIRAAAIRELFEEAGILLARRGRRFAREARLRQAPRAAGGWGTVRAGDAGRLELEPAFDRLVMFARWVTPAQMRRRFDARFFLARLPAGQSVHPQEGEVTDWLWISPEQGAREPRDHPRLRDADRARVGGRRRMPRRSSPARAGCATSRPSNRASCRPSAVGRSSRLSGRYRQRSRQRS